MCGIGGILRVHPPGAAAPPPEVAIPGAWLDIIDESIKHRGPDGCGRFRDRTVRADGTVVDVALVHRRMAILDHTGGGQPMVLYAAGVQSPRALSPGTNFLGTCPGCTPGPESRGTQIAVVFNGCIYNHRELRKELEGNGHRFETDHSDTEVLLHGWRQWGDDLPGRLEGMFALAVWDSTDGRLLLARDLFGEKPLNLYHSHRDGAWYNIFASSAIEATPLRTFPGPGDESIPAIVTAVSWLRFGASTYSCVPNSRVVHPSLAVQYEPGNGGASLPRPWWFGPLRHGNRPALPARSIELGPNYLADLLSQAVKERLQADVPLGCFLSGGVDSSLIAHFAKQHAGSLRTFTVRMPDARYDESQFAAEAAKAIGTDHMTLDCDPQPAEDLIHLIGQIGVPFGDSSLLPTYWVSKAARQHVKVALSGDGGDELFMGYERYLWAKWFGWPKSILGRAAGFVSPDDNPKSRRSKAARLLEAARGDGYADLISIFPRRMLDQLIVNRQFTSWEAALERWSPASAGAAAAHDLFVYLPDDLLRKTDSASMSVALEVRCPFLDPDVALAALQATMESLMPYGERKGLLRQVARKYLPAEIVDRPKMGFAIPIGDWFRTDYGQMKTLLLDRLNSADPFPASVLGLELNRRFIEQMVDEHMSGRRDHGQRLYMLLVLAIWVNTLRA